MGFTQNMFMSSYNSQVYPYVIKVAYTLARRNHSMKRFSEEDHHLFSTKEIAEKLNISEQEVLNWRKQAPMITEADPEEKKRASAGGSVKPEDVLGQIGKKHFLCPNQTAEYLGISYDKVRRVLLHGGLVDGLNVCKIRVPEKNFTCYWIYKASIEAYKRKEQ